MSVSEKWREPVRHLATTGFGVIIGMAIVDQRWWTVAIFGAITLWGTWLLRGKVLST